VNFSRYMDTDGASCSSGERRIGRARASVPCTSRSSRECFHTCRGTDRPVPHDGLVKSRSRRRVYGTDFLRWDNRRNGSSAGRDGRGGQRTSRGIRAHGHRRLDEMLVRRADGHIITVLGSFGTGRRRRAAVLDAGFDQREKAIFISLEEAPTPSSRTPRRSVDLPTYIKEKKLHIVKLEPRTRRRPSLGSGPSSRTSSSEAARRGWRLTRLAC